MDIKMKCHTCSEGGKVVTVAMRDMKGHNLVEHPYHSVRCKLCQCAFMTKEAMEAHLAVEHVKYPCIECFRNGEEILMPRDELHLHYLHKHPLCSIECSICKNRFQLEKTLVDHKRMFHVTSKPSCLLICFSKIELSTCFFSFFFFRMILRLTPKVKCINCKRFTGVKKKLQAHNASVHGNGYPHECTFCGNVFKYSAKRDDHSDNTCEYRD